jgi:hypothetical protein
VEIVIAKIVGKEVVLRGAVGGRNLLISDLYKGGWLCIFCLRENVYLDIAYIFEVILFMKMHSLVSIVGVVLSGKDKLSRMVKKDQAYSYLQ